MSNSDTKLTSLYNDKKDTGYIYSYTSSGGTASDLSVVNRTAKNGSISSISLAGLTKGLNSKITNLSNGGYDAVWMADKIYARIFDAFPFTQFGSIRGEISKIGAASIPSESQNIPPKFPTYIKLDKKFFIKDNIQYDLKSGQSISANIVIRKKRLITVISDIFSKAFDSLRKIKER